MLVPCLRSIRFASLLLFTFLLRFLTNVTNAKVNFLANNFRVYRLWTCEGMISSLTKEGWSTHRERSPGMRSRPAKKLYRNFDGQTLLLGFWSYWDVLLLHNSWVSWYLPRSEVYYYHTYAFDEDCLRSLCSNWTSQSWDHGTKFGNSQLWALISK